MAGSVQDMVRGLYDALSGGSLKAVLTAGSAVIGKLAANSGTDIGDVTVNNTLAGAVPASDAGAGWTSVWGVSNAPVTSADMSGAAVAVTAAPTAGQKLIITDLLLGTDTDLSFTLTEETSGTVIFGPLYMAANSTQQITVRSKRKLATANKKLLCQTSAAGNVSVLAGYHSEA